MARFRVVALGASFVLAGVACRSAPGESVYAERLVRARGFAAPDASAREDARAPDAAAFQPLLGWSDPRVVPLIAENCSFDPTKDIASAAKRLGYSDNWSDPLASLTCGGVFEQSCLPDPCDSEPCRQECGHACDDCSKPCIEKCATCKSACTDDACRTRCASSCASCRGECVSAGDRCVTGVCSQRREKCHGELSAKITRLGCREPCAKKRDCDYQCMDAAEAKSPVCVSCKKFKPPAKCADLCAIAEVL